MEKRDTPVEVKVCSRCSHKKLNTEFYRDASKPDGLQVLPDVPPHAARESLEMIGPLSMRQCDGIVSLSCWWFIYAPNAC